MPSSNIEVEIYFSILQRQAISPNDFTTSTTSPDKITSLRDRYNATAEPLDWTYTRHDLSAFLKRLWATTTYPGKAVQYDPTNSRA